MLTMEVDPPSSSNISTPLYNYLVGDLHSTFMSRDLESSLNGNGTISTPGLLKRSSSAPMINLLVSSASCVEIDLPSYFQTIDGQRTRRFSSSFTPFNSSTGDHEPMIPEMASRRPRSFSESLHIFTSPCMAVGAPSPTRVGKQCFSPSMQAPIKTVTFTPSPSPSPTRKSFQRSSSPNIIRPSPLGKRKLETDDENKIESYMSPPKKIHSGTSTPDKFTPHPLAHSISVNSCGSSSPEQMVSPTSLSHNIPTGNRPQPHLYGFMPLCDSSEMQTTDSEMSDVTESTDMSEGGDSSSSSSTLLLTTSTSPAGHTVAFTTVQPHQF